MVNRGGGFKALALATSILAGVVLTDKPANASEAAKENIDVARNQVKHDSHIALLGLNEKLKNEREHGVKIDTGDGDDGLEKAPEKKYKTFEEAGLDLSELRKEAVFLNTPPKVHKFILNLLEKGISPQDVETLLPAIKIDTAPKPLYGVVPEGHEFDSISIESLDLPEKVTVENFLEVAKKIIIPRNNPEDSGTYYPEYEQKLNDFFVNNVVNNPELGAKIIHSVNLYLDYVKSGEKNPNFEGEGMNPWLLERGVTRIAFILKTLASDPTLEDTYGKGFLNDVYNILVAFGADVSGAQKLTVTGGQSYIIIQINKNTALSLDKMGIEMPVDTIAEYNKLYGRLVGKMKERVDTAKSEKVKERRQKGFEKNLKIYGGLSLSSKLQALDIYAKRLQSELSGDDAEAKLASMLVKFQAGIDNYKNYLAGGKLDKTLSLELHLDAQDINNRYPGTFTQEQMETFKEVEGFVSLRLSQEITEISQDNEKLSQEIAEQEKFIKKLELLVSS